MLLKSNNKLLNHKLVNFEVDSYVLWERMSDFREKVIYKQSKNETNATSS